VSLGPVDVLCIGAHPDDVEVAMGGTVVKMIKDGLRVGLVDLTDGEPTPFGTHEIRMREAALATAALGATWRRTLEHPNRSLEPTLDARRELAELIRETTPRLLFTHYPHDGHPDHVAACALVEAARFWAKLVKTDMAGAPHYPAHIYHFMAVHLRLHEKPTFIVDITDELPAKMSAMHCYASQFANNPKNTEFARHVESTAAYFGGLIRTAAGEPFFAREPIGLASPSRLL